MTEPPLVFLTLAEFDELLEYSCSLPTGVTVGKRWKRGEPYMQPRRRWYLGEYAEHPTNPDLVRIVWHRIAIAGLKWDALCEARLRGSPLRVAAR